MNEILFLLIGLAGGGAAAWVICSLRSAARSAAAASQLEARTASAEGIAAELRSQLDRGTQEAAALRAAMEQLQQAKVQAQTQLTEATKSFGEQKDLLDQAKTRLADAFKALSSDALRSNNQAFLELARSSLDTVVAEAKGDIGRRQEAIDSLIKPLSTSLLRYEQQVASLEAVRLEAYAGLQEQIKAMTSTQQQLQKETGKLVNSLQAPQVRGRWGEITLHRVVELAGMSDHCDYAEQVSVESADGKLRPDMIVHLPSQRDIVVDSKVSLDAYLRAVSAGDQVQRDECLRQHAQQIRTHMQKLSSKNYWEQFDKAPEFVVMFIPGESFFAAALDCDTSLLEDGMKQRVVMATPTTLIALLRAVAFGWRQEQMAQNAQAICDQAKDLYDRIGVLASHIVNLGRNLKTTTENYNKVVGSMEARVLSAARRFKDMGVSGGDGIAVIEPLDVTPRTLTHETQGDGPAGEA